MIDGGNVLILAGKELRDARRNRWFLLYTVGLAALALALSALGVSGVGSLALGGFGRTTASLVNLVMLIVPLMGLTLGALSLAVERERGTLLYVLAQPVTPLEVYLGKYLGLAGALLGALLIGFGVSGLAVAWRAGSAQIGSFLGLVGLAFLLALVSLSLGLMLSSLARKSTTAVGMAVFLWLALVFGGDLGLMGTALALRLEVSQLLGLALVNPLHVFKIAAVASTRGTLDVLGPAGLYAMRTLGDGLVPLLIGVMAVWVVLPLGAGFVAFRRRGAL